MSSNFAKMKTNRAQMFEALHKKVEDMTSGGGKKDERQWYPAVDKAGNGFSIIRFLPAPDGEDSPFVRLFTHAFKGPTGQWYIENSLTTLGDKDPVSEYNSKLWNSTEDDKHPNRQQARDQKRKLNYIANVLVIKDSLNPENEGKVFLFKFGQKIWDKLNGKMHPEFPEQEAPMNPFDLWEGANFRLKIKKVGDFRNYDESQFDAPSALFGGDDAKLEAIWKQEYPLQPFIARDQFKSYDELKTKLETVLGHSIEAVPGQKSAGKAEYAPPAGKEVAARPAPTAAASSEDGDEELPDFLKNLG